MARLRIFTTGKRICIKEQDNRNKNISSGCLPFARNFKKNFTQFILQEEQSHQANRSKSHNHMGWATI